MFIFLRAKVVFYYFLLLLEIFRRNSGRIRMEIWQNISDLDLLPEPPKGGRLYTQCIVVNDYAPVTD